ncbi:MAG: lamin tail domain-containing protein [Acidobacteria bacterium]|nr:lamin tail domain-containing protein [Acidobacteriota bacterium]
MQPLRKLFFVALATLALGFAFSTSQVAFAQGSPDLVISQIYGGAGCGTAGCSTYKNDFIEIYNRGTTPVSLNGLSVQYSSATGTTINNSASGVTPLTNFTLQPGQYYLVAEAFNANGVTALPPPNTTGTIALAATAGKVFLANTTTAITLTASGCPATPSQVRDFVGYGTTANCFEGAGRAPAPSTTTADIRNGGGSVDTDNNNLDFTAATPTPRNSLVGTMLLISEFRTFGPTGSCDEFVEIYNPSSSSFTVQSLEAGSAGFAVAQSNGNVLFTIPNNTIIPARGHYLAVNNGGGACTGSFSGSAYPSGSGTTATGDNTLNEDIPTNAGIALFNTSLQANFTLANRIDAVGAATETNPIYVEGTGYPPLSAALSGNPGINYSLFRDARSGLPQDTNNNETDFQTADINGTNLCASTINFICQRLGAPGPENLASPVQSNATIKASLVDPQCASIAVNPTLPSACRFERRTGAGSGFGGSPTSTGTLSIRRRFTNNTGAPVSRLRFRIVDITTFPAPLGTADLRAISSTQVTATCQSESGTPHLCSDNASPQTVIEGTTLETDAAGQPNGGGFNSSLSAGTVTLANPLANGASVNLQFLLGVEQNGSFRFFVNVEALTAPPPSPASATKAQATRKARAAGNK